MSKPKEKFKNDRTLRFYSEVLGLDRLHYGMWEDTDERNLEGVKIAQIRYEKFLISKISQLFPHSKDVHILDVGCGTGIMSEKLHHQNFTVEGLSPDLYQQEVFEKRIPVKFHLARFQNFQPTKKYDLILMSESSQYIPLFRLFENARKCLKSGGYIMICDYFTFNNASGPLAKSGHNLEAFLKTANQNSFKIVQQEDITEKTIPTLETAQIFTNTYILPSISIFSEKFQQKKPWLFKTVKWLLRKKIAKAYSNMVLIDAVEFKKNKCYKYFVFQLEQ